LHSFNRSRRRASACRASRASLSYARRREFGLDARAASPPSGEDDGAKVGRDFVVVARVQSANRRQNPLVGNGPKYGHFLSM
jgi:hypothetical protein